MIFVESTDRKKAECKSYLARSRCILHVNLHITRNVNESDSKFKCFSRSQGNEFLEFQESTAVNNNACHSTLVVIDDIPASTA